ncbi:MAG: hypothetical protein NTW51_15560 [Cyanobacteria bacterium]|nr:hypothetical protein [Cyanobacteriota bacterium]
MPDPQARDPHASRARLPDQGSGSYSRRAQLQRDILRAGEKAQQVAYAQFRVQVRMELGAPSEPSRGTGDCLALVLVALGLILMLVHPAPAIAVWVLSGCLVLAGSNQMKRDRAAIRAADAEAERRWRRQQLLSARLEEEEGPFTAPLRPQGPPRPDGSEPQRPG